MYSVANVSKLKLAYSYARLINIKMFVAVKMEVIDRVVAAYNDLMENKSDPRVKGWFLMSSPFPTLMICLTYVLIVKVSIFI